MTESFARRYVSGDLSLDKQGIPYRGSKRTATTSVFSQYGVKQIAVITGTSDSGEIVITPIWRLLSHFFYDRKIILPRDGNALDYSTKNVIVVSKLTHSKDVPAITDPDEILLVWVMYCKGTSCDEMSAATKLIGYSIDQFRSLVSDILVAGVR